MNITKEVKDDLTAVLKINVNKDDYEKRVEKVLEDYRKKARIDGFRPGKVPAGMIKKLYGKAVTAEEINKVLSENLTKYIKDENIQILGEPLPSEKEQKPIDWDNQTDFEFVFDLGLSPQFDLKISKKDKVTNYTILPDEKMIASYVDNYTRRFGAFKSIEKIEDGKEMLKGTFVEMNEEGAVKENGIVVDDSSIYLEFMKDEEIKKQFMGLQQNDVVTFNLRKAYPNDVELGSILKKKKTEVTSINSDFQFTIQAISKFENAPLNQELFDKIFGADTVKSEEEFRTRVEDEVKLNLSRDTDYKLRLDLKEKMIDLAKFDLPVEFLKRWIIVSNEGKYTQEQIDQDFPKFERDLKWQLIQNKIIKENDLKISDEEILDFAMMQTRLQFEQYGLFNVPEENLINYAQESLKREEDRRRIIERKYEDKVIDFLKSQFTLDTKDVTPDDFNKLFEENK